MLQDNTNKSTENQGQQQHGQMHCQQHGQMHGQPKPRRQKKKVLADEVSKQWGVDQRRVYRAAEYYDAVTALAQMFGGDILYCILDRQVRLAHRAVVNLSKAAQGRYHFVFTELGDAIRNRDTQMINCYVKLARNLK